MRRTTRAEAGTATCAGARTAAPALAVEGDSCGAGTEALFAREQAAERLVSRAPLLLLLLLLLTAACAARYSTDSSTMSVLTAGTTGGSPSPPPPSSALTAIPSLRCTGGAVAPLPPRRLPRVPSLPCASLVALATSSFDNARSKNATQVICPQRATGGRGGEGEEEHGAATRPGGIMDSECLPSCR